MEKRGRLDAPAGRANQSNGLQQRKWEQTSPPAPTFRACRLKPVGVSLAREGSGRSLSAPVGSSGSVRSLSASFGSLTGIRPKPCDFARFPITGFIGHCCTADPIRVLHPKVPVPPVDLESGFGLRLALLRPSSVPPCLLRPSLRTFAACAVVSALSKLRFRKSDRASKLDHDSRLRVAASEILFLPPVDKRNSGDNWKNMVSRCGRCLPPGARSALLEPQRTGQRGEDVPLYTAESGP